MDHYLGNDGMHERIRILIWNLSRDESVPWRMIQASSDSAILFSLTDVALGVLLPRDEFLLFSLLVGAALLRGGVEKVVVCIEI